MWVPPQNVGQILKETLPGVLDGSGQHPARIPCETNWDNSENWGIFPTPNQELLAEILYIGGYGNAFVAYREEITIRSADCLP